MIDDAVRKLNRWMDQRQALAMPPSPPGEEVRGEVFEVSPHIRRYSAFLDGAKDATRGIVMPSGEWPVPRDQVLIWRVRESGLHVHRAILGRDPVEPGFANPMTFAGQVITSTTDGTPTALPVAAPVLPLLEHQKLRVNKTTGLFELVDDTASGGGIPATLVDAKGDLIAATAADTVARLPVGANGLLLLADSAQTAGLKWGALPDGSITTAQLAAAAKRLRFVPFTVNVDIATNVAVTADVAATWAAIAGVPSTAIACQVTCGIKNTGTDLNSAWMVIYHGANDTAIIQRCQVSNFRIQLFGTALLGTGTNAGKMRYSVNATAAGGTTTYSISVTGYWTLED